MKIITKAVLTATALTLIFSCAKPKTYIHENFDKYDDKQVVYMLFGLEKALCDKKSEGAQFDCYVTAMNELVKNWRELKSRSSASSAILDEMIQVKEKEFIQEYAYQFYSKEHAG